MLLPPLRRVNASTSPQRRSKLAPDSNVLETRQCSQPCDSFIAFTGLIPNPNTSKGDLDTIFNNYSFGCKNGKNFTASILQSSTVSPKPWFAGDEYDLTQEPGCTPDAIAGLISTAITTQNSGANGSVTCVQYTGATTNSFQVSSYFGLRVVEWGLI